MKKQVLAALLSLCLIVELLPISALAEEGAPAGTAVGLAALDANVRGDSSQPGDVVYFGNIPWYLLDKEYETGATGENAVSNGYLFISRYCYNDGTQWNGYSRYPYTDDGTAYQNSDIRTYLTGQGTYTAFKAIAAHGDWYCYGSNPWWERNTVQEDDGPQDGVVYYTRSTDETDIKYTPVELSDAADWKAGVWYVKTAGDNGEEIYTLSEAEEFVSGTYYRDDTPYVYAGTGGADGFSFSEGTAYYYFARGAAQIKAQDGSDAGNNLLCAYYYEGGSVTTADSDGSDGARRIVAGRTPEQSGVSFAADHAISDTEMDAVVPVTRAAVTSAEKYTVKSSDAGKTYACYGDQLDGDTFFLLSAQEAAPLDTDDAANGYWTSQAERTVKYMDKKYWYNWCLRTSYMKGGVLLVDCDGLITSVNPINTTYTGIRPAFVLDPASVLFISAATGGKSGSTTADGVTFVNLADDDTSTWKLTLRDEDLTLGDAIRLIDWGDGTCTLSYEDASTYGDDVYVSAILTDADGNTIYRYAKLAAVDSADAQSGSVAFELPDGLALGETGNCTLKVFLEKASSTASATDYAGEPVAPPVTLGFTVDDIEWSTYTGTAIEPAITVRHGDTILDLDEDYTVTYADNVDVAYGGEKIWIQNAVATVTGKEGSLYADITVKKNFGIMPKSVKEAVITLEDGVAWDGYPDCPCYTYTGGPVHPAVESVVLDGVPLAENEDYTVSYSETEAMGINGLYIYGIGNYMSKAAASYLLIGTTFQAELDPYYAYYNGQAQTPNVTVTKIMATDEQTDPVSVVLEETEYTVTYKNSSGDEITAGQMVAVGSYTVVVTLNDYDADPIELSYTIRSVSSGGGNGGGGGGGGTESYTITAEAGEGGSVSPAGSVSVSKGSDKAFTITPDSGYLIQDVTVDSESVGAVATYTFQDVRKNHTLSVTFKKDSTAGSAAIAASADPSETGVDRWFNVSEHGNYLNGYGDGAFGPTDNMTRGQAAQMFYNLLLNKDVTVTVTFKDVPENAWYKAAVNTLASLDILYGVGDGSFAPDLPITRAEFAAIAMRFTNAPADAGNCFSDVDGDEWYAEAVNGCARYGWITGYDDGTFRAGNYITRAEVAAITNRMMGRAADEDAIDGRAGSLRSFTDVSRSNWAYYDIMEAANSHDYRKDGGVETWE